MDRQNEMLFIAVLAGIAIVAVAAMIISPVDGGVRVASNETIVGGQLFVDEIASDEAVTIR